jgi:hypothetical protein
MLEDNFLLIISSLLIWLFFVVNSEAGDWGSYFGLQTLDKLQGNQWRCIFSIHFLLATVFILAQSKRIVLSSGCHCSGCKQHFSPILWSHHDLSLHLRIVLSTLVWMKKQNGKAVMDSSKYLTGFKETDMNVRTFIINFHSHSSSLWSTVLTLE